MRERKVAEGIEGKRMLGIDEAAKYLGLGKVVTRAWMDEIGATRKFGRRVLFDKQIIDRALDQSAQ
ncbi:MAG: polyprenyl synthetase solanesyl diphosphate synthase [Lachnospiraceae bacterium]|nr:polyprenyl synthetase solanesyl diphosphate synthase [Lachnospiraceae bacterium]